MEPDTHFLRNLLTRVPKSAGPFVATLVRSIFAQPDAPMTHAQHARVIEQLTDRFPAAAEMLADAGPEILTLPRSRSRIDGRSGPTIRGSG